MTMNNSLFSPRWLFLGLALAMGLVFSAGQASAADSIKGTYTFEGKAKAKGAGGKSTKKFKGKIKIGLKSVTLQIPVSRDGKVGTCQQMVRAQLNRKLSRNPSRASRRATFTNATCGTTKWNGSLRLKWVEHPEGYALSFSMAGVNIDIPEDKITGKFRGSVGTLSTAENQPEIPEPDPVVVDDHGA